jgi:hypothetical protein
MRVVMNEIFNLKRFLMIVKEETCSFRKHYFFFVIFAAAYAATVFLIGRSSVKPEGFAPIGCILIIIAPFILYKDVYHKIRGVNYTMLPASNIEKWIAFWLQCVVFVPLIIGASWIFLQGLEFILFHVPINLNSDWSQIRKVIVSIYGLQSIAMMGVMSFSRLKVLKTFGFLFLLQVITLIISSFFAHQFDFKDIILQSQISTFNINHTWWFMDYMKAVIYIVFPLGLWLASFFKLQEQEL